MTNNDSLTSQQKKLDIFYKNSKFGWIGLIILWLALLAAYGFPNNTITIVLIFFALTGVLLHLLSYFLYQKWRQEKFTMSSSKARKKWHYIFILLSAYNGIIVGISPLFLLDINNISMVFLITSLIILPIFGSAVISGTSRSVHIVWTLATTQIISFMLIFSNNQELMLLGIMIEIGAVPTAILMSLYFNKLYSESINLSLNNKKLLDQTEDLKKIVTEESAEKTWLMSTMSHDLSQPVQALNIFLDSLKLEIKNPKQLNILNKAKQSSAELTDLLKSLEEIGRLASKNLQTHIQVINLSKILQYLINETSKQAEKNQIQIINLTAETIVFSDKVLLTRIIRNLLINSITHNKNCQIYLKTTPANNKIKLEICDTGKGIAKADLDKIFDAYYQTNHYNRGSGLGLSLVKKATTALNIPMNVSSKVLHGTCFSLELEAITP